MQPPKSEFRLSTCPEHLDFVQLNDDWNAEPNAPQPRGSWHNGVYELDFYLAENLVEPLEAKGRVIFTACAAWRWEMTNDHGWYAGQGLYARQSPTWGEFYEVLGDDPEISDRSWEGDLEEGRAKRHFVFYFRDNAFECFADDWCFKPLNR